MPQSIRPHQKSRKGCLGCKSRRVKCDEVRPRCAACIRRDVECMYQTVTLRRRQAGSVAGSSRPRFDSSSDVQRSDVQPPLSFQHLSEAPQYLAKHLLDLRLMHHYSVFTTQYFAESLPEAVSTMLKVHLPLVALEHEFLLDAILLVAMVHLGCTEPACLERLPVYLYRDQALRNLRRAVANISPQTARAVRGASVLLATVSLATDRITSQPGLWVVNWLILVLGHRNFRALEFLERESTLEGGLNSIQSPATLYGALHDMSTPGAIVVGVQQALSREESDVDPMQRQVLHDAAFELGRLIAILEYPYDEVWLERKIKAWAFDVVPATFLDLVRQEQPQALVVMAYYLALFRFLPDAWPYQGVAHHDLEEIRKTIGPAWEQYISVPTMTLRMDNKADAARVLVDCLPGRGQISIS